MQKNLLIGAAMAAFSMGFASNAMADNINVTDAASLKSAVANAANGDVITLAAGTYLLDSEIDVNNKSLTFVGVGKVVLDGQKTVRVMNVHNNANAVVENLIIQNGYVTDNGNNKGAGIRLDEGSLTVKNCKFLNNTVDPLATDGNWTGGAGIHANKAKLTVTNCEFTGGTAFQGGAMTVQNSDITATNVLFEGNKTKYDGKKDASKGGAICMRADDGTVHTHDFVNCVFKDNVAWGNGGAVSYNVSGGAAGQNTTFRGCSFIRNTTNVDINNLARTTDNDGLRGGAVFIDTDGKMKAHFFSCTIAQNYAALGGGAVAIPGMNSKPEAELWFVNCTITDNHNLDNSGNGAGVWISNNADCGGIKIINTILTGNWSIKVKDGNGEVNDGSDYIADTAKGEDWRHWEYSDLSTTGATKQDLFEISNTVIGYLNNAENYNGNYPNIKIQRETQAWVDGESAEDQLGDLAKFNEDYFVYPFNSSAQTWFEGELGDMETAKKLGCTTDQFGNEWETTCIGAVQTDENNIEDYEAPVFFIDNNDPTGINGVSSDVKAIANNAWYTVSGVRVAQPAAKGIYIYNGKKVVK